MKIILTILIVFLTSNYMESQTKINKMKLENTWFSGEMEINGKPVIIRGRSHLKNLMESKKYNEIIQITWKMENPTENGIPTTDENIFMKKIEDSLIESIESDLQSVLAFVQTFNNSRTWFFYTKKTEIFMERLNRILKKYRQIPISIEFLDDSEWSAYSKVLSDFNIELK